MSDRLHALVFNAITNSLPADRFVSLSEREAATKAVLDVIAESRQALLKHADDEHDQGWREATAYFQGLALGYTGPGAERVCAFALWAVLKMQAEVAEMRRAHDALASEVSS